MADGAASPLWVLAASAIGPILLGIYQYTRASRDKSADRDAAARDSLMARTDARTRDLIDRLERETLQLRARVDEVEAERDRVWLAARAMERFAIQVVREANARLQSAASGGRLQGAGVLMPDGQQASTPLPLDPPPALESFLPAPPAE